ncbi:chromosome segregation smc [Fusarium albosuccineum]|uniref:Chromosome segregation smc n=1 Tax=Fusarium albosuccineum TaxID=1237068 RepID=A0A8H4LIZ4_9HYPO|nr:chromosome segregation smc [Fusarium albosuccineum]
MTQGNFASSEYHSNETRVASRWSSSTESRQETKTSASMLSINFSTPLAGAARSERIKQMTNNHPAFVKARASQEILVKIQTSLRRMPGISSKESSELAEQLQEVGQIISTETSQLVDALMNLTLDQEDTDKAIARMSIEANLAKAEADDQTNTISNLRVELANEKGKRQEAEAEVAKVMKDLQNLTREFKSLKDKENDGNSDGTKSTPDRAGMIKHLEDTIKHLEDQVNSRRSLWVMKNPSPDSVARAIETIADACPDKGVVHKSIMSLRPEGREETDSRDINKGLSHVFNDLALQPHRPPPSFQSSRPGSVAPPRFGPHGMPPRASSTMPNDRRFGQWAPPTPAQSRFGNQPNGSGPAPGFGRGSSRRGFSNGTYRPNAPEFYPQAFGNSDNKGFNRNEGGFGQQRRDYYPPTPSNGRNKYGRFRDPISPEFAAPPGALTTRPPFPGPLIHITEMTIAAWNEQMMELYTVIRNFVDNNANQPTFLKPTDLSQTRLWPVLMAAYYPLSEHEAVSYLEFHLKEESSKSCLVTRVIVDFIVNRVWVPRAWAGADNDATYGLIEVEKELERTHGTQAFPSPLSDPLANLLSLGQPASQRQPILDRQASVIDSILKLEHYRQFSKARCDEIADMLLHMVQPLLNANANPATTYHDLEVVANAAWALSSRILSSRLTFDFRFPEIGSRFSSQSMVPIWPNMEPVELQAKHWRVALVTTPVVTCRNDTGANISAHSVSLADVVCMQ